MWRWQRLQTVELYLQELLQVFCGNLSGSVQQPTVNLAARDWYECPRV